MTQQALGGLMGYSRSAIAMIEAGERHDVERLSMLVPLCQALKVDLQEFLSAPVPGVEIDPSRLRELRAVFGPQGLPPPGVVGPEQVRAVARARESHAVTGDAIEVYRTILRALHHAEDRIGSHRGLLRASEAHLGTLREWLADGQREPLVRPLGLLTAEYGQFCGWMAYDQRNSRHAIALYADALEDVEQLVDRNGDGASDGDLAAYLTGNLASVEIGQEMPGSIARAAGSPNPAALTRAEHAEALATTARSPHARALILADVSWVYGLAGPDYHDRVASLLDHAAEALDEAEQEDAPPWAYWFDLTMLQRRRARGLVQIGRHQEAQVELRRVLAALPRELVRDQVITRGYLADSLISTGDADEAARLLSESAALLRRAASRRMEGRLRGLYGRLLAHGGNAAVRELGERLRALRHES